MTKWDHSICGENLEAGSLNIGEWDVIERFSSIIIGANLLRLTGSLHRFGRKLPGL